MEKKKNKIILTIVIIIILSLIPLNVSAEQIESNNTNITYITNNSTTNTLETLNNYQTLNTSINEGNNTLNESLNENQTIKQNLETNEKKQDQNLSLNTNSSKNNLGTNLENITIFLISDNPGTNILDMASKTLINSGNYTNLNIIVRSGNQIKEMNETELYNLIYNCDIFIDEWVSTDVDAVLTSLLGKNPQLSNKKLFLILEPPTSSTSTSLKLMRYNTINYQKIFSNTSYYTDSKLSSYFTNTLRGLNYDNVYQYITKGEGKNFNSNFNKAVLYKDLNDKDNLLNQILWAINLCGYPTKYEEPNNTGSYQYGIYRERYFDSLEEYMTQYFNSSHNRTIGIIESTMYVSNQQLSTYYSIINSFEAEGYNVIPLVAAGGSAEQLTVMVKYFTNANSTSEFLSNSTKYNINVDAIISMPAYGIGGQNFSNATSFFENLDVPVFRAVQSDYVSNEEWELSTTGLPGNRSDKWWHVAIAEAQGIIDATFIGGVSNTISNYTGARLTGYVPYEKNIKYLTERVNSWVNLQYKANDEKLISLIYYNYPPGKQNIGSSYLDTITSIYNMLYELQKEGYNVGDKLPSNTTELENMMIKCGINVATWAPGELEKLANNSNVVLLPVSEYMAWFNNLENITKVQIVEGPVAYIGELARQSIKINYTSPMDERLTEWYNQIVSLLPDNRSEEAIPILKEIVESLKVYLISGNESDYNKFLELKTKWAKLNISGLNGWGEAPGNIMTVNKNGTDYFVIPGLKFGNIFIAPEPQRGWESDSSLLYHSTAVAPTHQYLAAYYYFQTYYPSAMTFVGRHGTHEFLPGKEILLSTTDFGTICTGYVPQIYYYTSDGLAEAIQAKRRGYAVMIDHLTSPMSHTQLYGNLTVLSTLLVEYENSTNQIIKDNLINEIKHIITVNNLVGSIGLNETDLNKLSNTDLISTLNNYLYNVQMTLYPLGLHAIGQNWTDDDIGHTVAAALGYEFTYNGVTTTLYDEISQYLYSKDFTDLNPLQRDIVLNRSVQVVIALIYWDVDVVSNALGTNNTNLITCFNYAKIYISYIQLSIKNEVDNWLDALNGSYIPVSTDGDALDLSVYPTGNNFYQDQSQELPTQEAYTYGKVLALLTLSSLTDSVEKIVMGIWCVETARDDGALVSVVLYLLGMKPVYTSSPSAGGSDEDGALTGTKTSTMPEYLSLDDLVRPEGWDKKRIDITIITSGLFRDLYSTQAVLMDNAFRVALARSYKTIINNQTLMNSKYGSDMKIALDEIMEGINYYGIGSESFDDNYVAKHWVSDFLYYKGLGYNTTYAGECAITRIFAPPNGDYGAGISKSVQLSWTWNNTDDLAKFYLGRMGNMYSKNYWGESNPTVFARALSNVNKIVVSRNTNQYGVLDNDDFFDYWGGLSLAVSHVNGKEPSMDVLEYANRDNAYIASLEKVLNQELLTRYLNPNWITGMMGEGYSGARYISNKFVTNLLGWSVTRSSTVNNWMWDSVYNTYINDQYNLGVTSWLKQGNNAYSLISTTGTMLTAAYNGYWSTDEATLKNVANTWAEAVINNGVACCDCSCGNIAMMQWAIKYINPDMLQQFNEQMYQATHNKVFATNTNTPSNPTNPSNPSSTNPSDGSSSSSGSVSSGELVNGTSNSESSGSSAVGMNSMASSSSSSSGSSNSEAGASKGAEGDSYEISQSQSSSSSKTGMSIPALIGVISIVLLVAFGYWRGKHDND